MRTFTLLRHDDVSGVSGTGHVGQGAEFNDGTVAFRWFGQRPTWGLYESIKDFAALHTHGGKSEVVWDAVIYLERES